MQTKEEDRPEGVKDKVDKKEDEGLFNGRILGAKSPN